MNKLHGIITNKPLLVPSEVQVDIPCSNGLSVTCTSLGGNKPFIELAKTFKAIHIRLLAMGYKIENGRLIENNNKKNEK
jgi:hypothetical protein